MTAALVPSQRLDEAVQQLADRSRGLGFRLARRGQTAALPFDRRAVPTDAATPIPACGFRAGRGRAGRLTPVRPTRLPMPRDRRCHADQLAQEKGPCPMRDASRAMRGAP